MEKISCACKGAGEHFTCHHENRCHTDEVDCPGYVIDSGTILDGTVEYEIGYDPHILDKVGNQ